MAERMHRAQILLEPDQHRVLTEIARSEGRSGSEVVREVIRQQLEQRRQAANPDLQRQLAALERIRAHREAILAERGGKPLELDTVEMLNQMREERDARILGSITEPRD